MILVTGGTGLVGAHLLYQLCLNNTRVKAIYRNNGTLQLVKNVFGLFSEDYDTLFNKAIIHYKENGYQLTMDWLKSLFNEDKISKSNMYMYIGNLNK